jgi:hypothetical protein
MERFGSGSGWSQRSPPAAIFGEREEERKNKEPDQTGIGTLPCPKGVSDGGALHVYVVRPSSSWIG